MNPQELSFHSDGLHIAGYLCAPEDWKPGDERRPGILVLPGYAGNPLFDCIHMMKRLAADGWFAFSFAYRGFGQSEGVRTRHRPMEQVQDAYNALSFMETIDGIDPQRLGIFGTSFGGAHGIWVAAHDERVKCLVTSVAVTNGQRWMKLLRRPWEWFAFKDRIAEEARQRVRGADPGLLSIDEIIIRDPHAQREMEIQRGKTLQKGVELDLASVAALFDFRPDWLIHRISPRPVLMIYGERDNIVPPEEALECYAACGEPKKLVKLPGANHYDSYEFRNPEMSKIVHAETAAWFRQYL